jgi:hypothetical protein
MHHTDIAPIHFVCLRREFYIVLIRRGPIRHHGNTNHWAVIELCKINPSRWRDALEIGTIPLLGLVFHRFHKGSIVCIHKVIDVAHDKSIDLVIE